MGGGASQLLSLLWFLNRGPTNYWEISWFFSGNFELLRPYQGGGPALVVKTTRIFNCMYPLVLVNSVQNFMLFCWESWSNTYEYKFVGIRKLSLCMSRNRRKKTLLVSVRWGTSRPKWPAQDIWPINTKFNGMEYLLNLPWYFECLVLLQENNLTLEYCCECLH